MLTSAFKNFDEDNKVLVLEYVSSTPHFETSVEIALRLSERNSDVTYCHIGSTLPFEDFRRNIFGLSQSTLRMLDFRPKSGRRLDRVAALAKTEMPSVASQITWDFPKSWKRPGKVHIPSPYLESMDKLATFSYDDLPIGIGLANSLSTYLDRVTAIPANHRGLLEKILDSQMRVMSSLERLFQTGNFTDVVVFNGRFAVPHAAGEVAKRFGVKLWRHEMGANDLAGFQLLPFATHDQARVGRAALERWHHPEISVTEKTQIVQQATNYGGPLRRQEAAENAFCFSKGLRKRRREEDAGFPGDLITFFSSTEGEFELLGPLTPQTVFNSQRDAALALKEIAEEANAKLVIRVHPNVANHSRNETNWWKKFARHNAGDNCVVYGPKSKVDSYELLRQSKLVIVWYSTIGLEAVREGIPCLSLSDNPYRSAGAEIHLPKSLHDIRQSVAQPPKVQDPNSVLPWLYFLEVSPEKFHWFKPTGKHQGTLFGKSFR